MKARTVIVVAGLLAGMLSHAAAQEGDNQPAASPPEVHFSQRSLAGPRIGFTVIPGNSELGRTLDEKNISRIISQFGWHFEHRVIANGVGPAFVIEFVPLLGGVEYGKPILSTSLFFGIRMPSGYEFGVGPNLIIASSAYTGIVIGAGRTFDVQGISIPFNIVYAGSPAGGRIAFMVGYAI
jgi:hypothetical protein